MKLSDEIFKRYILIEYNLIPYGFNKDDNGYSFNKPIHNNEFELVVRVENSLLSAKLIDKEFNDEFDQINRDNNVGGFINSLKEKCREILIDIREKCFKRQYFISKQANRITELIYNKYNVIPEFLWDDTPGCGVFRNKDNDKWFGIIMNIPKNKIVGDSNTEIEVINIKLDEKTDELLNKNGIYKAFHMNKKNWVSIILDDTLIDDEIMELINISVSKSQANKYWIIPANPEYYDVEGAFNNSDIINWKQGNGIKNGDIIFMYVAKPVSAILYQCIVTEINIPYEYKSKELTINKLMKIKLIKRYNRNEYTFDILKNKYGISFIRGPRPLTIELKKDLLGE